MTGVWPQPNHLLICNFRVREKLGCKGNLPEVYDKVNRRAKTGHFVLILYKDRGLDIYVMSGPFKDFQNRMKKRFEKLVD